MHMEQKLFQHPPYSPTGSNLITRYVISFKLYTVVLEYLCKAQRYCGHRTPSASALAVS
jgi:hypothetical protein